MAVSSGAFSEKFRERIEQQLRSVVQDYTQNSDLPGFYGQMQYHLGWVDESFQTIAGANMGKLMRPAITLWAALLAAATAGNSVSQALKQALPAAVSLELLHNFSLIHDDIEDQDILRRHRKTVWAIWGAAQGINTGDGMFSLARIALWQILEHGCSLETAVQLGKIFDTTCILLCEGQYMDMSFEKNSGITTDAYMKMIGRKTGALIQTAMTFGAMIGAPDKPEIIHTLETIGGALGAAFQIRDDILGIWANSSELGKTSAGDLRRKKMTLPVIWTLNNCSDEHKAVITKILEQSGEASDTQIADMLAILQKNDARSYCVTALHNFCSIASDLLQNILPLTRTPEYDEAYNAIASTIHFIKDSV